VTSTWQRPPAGDRPGRLARLGKERLTRLGVAISVTVFVLLSTLHAVSVPLYVPPDEASHVGYAVSLLDGRLPVIKDRIRADGVPGMQLELGRRDPLHKRVWTANHPPLWYALIAGPVWLGMKLDPSHAGLKAVRLLAVAFGALGVLLVALLARELVPGRPQIAVAATAPLAVLPAFTHFSGILYNDALGVATATGTLLAAVVLIRRGLTWRRLAILAAVASAAALTRSSGLALAALAAVAAAAAALLERDTPHSLWRRLLRGAGAGALVIGAVAATSGWFWLRNLRLYGDVTGSAALFAHFRRKPVGGTMDVLLSPDYWTVQAQRVLDFSFYRFGPDAIAESRTVWARLLLVALPFGLAVVLGRRLRHRLLPSPRRPSWRLVAWALAGILVVGLEVTAAQFVAGGGNVHGRYIFPALGVLAILSAVCLGALPGGRHGLWLVGMAVALLGVNLLALEQYLRWEGLRTEQPSVIIQALDNQGLPGLLVLAGVGLAVAALVAVQALVLWRLAPPRTGFVLVPALARRDAARAGAAAASVAPPAPTEPAAAAAAAPVAVMAASERRP
jgi:hypothetical protein